MRHTRGAPYHPMTQGKIRRSHQTLKNRILLENYYLPGDLEAQINAFVAYYNHRRYHESIDNVTPANVYFGRSETILLERERIKRKTIRKPSVNSQQASRITSIQDAPELSLKSGRILFSKSLTTDNGNLIVLRQGTNDWVCFPGNENRIGNVPMPPIRWACNG